LKSRGLYEDAVIAFVSDHGEALWEFVTLARSWNDLVPPGRGESQDSVVR